MRIVKTGYPPDTPTTITFNSNDPRLGMPETMLRGLIIEYAEQRRWRIAKTYPYNSRPAMTAPWLELVRDRRIVYALCKPQNGRMSRIQQHHLQTLADAGANVHLWKPYDWITGAIRQELTRP